MTPRGNRRMGDKTMKAFCPAVVVLFAVVWAASAADIKVVREYRYPTSYVVTPIMGIGSNGVQTIVGGVVEASDFETREVGVIMSVEATVVDLNKLGNVAMESLQQKKTGTTDLMLAAASGDVDATKKSLSRGVMVNAKNQSGASALMGAAAGGFGEIVDLLLDRKANVNAKSNNGSTALMFAARNGHLDIVKKLLEKGADANTSDQKGLNAMLYAINGGHTDVVKALVEKGVKLESRDTHGTTPMKLASAQSKQDIVVLLTRAGAKM